MSKRKITRQMSAESSEKHSECRLCGTQHSNTSTPQQWKHLQKEADLVSSLGIPSDALVCRLCRRDITRLSKYTPRWMKEKTIKQCCIRHCSIKSMACSMMATQEEIIGALPLGGQVSDPAHSLHPTTDVRLEPAHSLPLGGQVSDPAHSLHPTTHSLSTIPKSVKELRFTSGLEAHNIYAYVYVHLCLS